MNLLIRNIFMTMAVACGITCAGTITLLLLGAEKYLPDFLTLSFAFTVIIIISVIVFIKGLSKTPQNGFWYTFVAMGVKMLLEMVLVIFWFVTAKKNSIEFVLIFFVLFLAFTSFLISFILKTLKKKNL